MSSLLDAYEGSRNDGGRISCHVPSITCRRRVADYIESESTRGTAAGSFIIHVRPPSSKRPAVTVASVARQKLAADPPTCCVAVVNILLHE